MNDSNNYFVCFFFPLKGYLVEAGWLATPHLIGLIAVVVVIIIFFSLVCFCLCKFNVVFF